MADPLAHFEINGSEAEQTGKFYSELFGWHTQTVPGDYILIDTHAGEGINGGIGQTDDGSANVRFYVEVADLQAALDKAESLGGKTVTPVTEIPDMVTYATFADPQGNTIGIVGSGPEDAPGVSAGDNPPVDWFEVLGPDPKALWSFYGELFGWDVHGNEGEFLYGEVHPEEGHGIGGGIGSTPDGQPHVNLYARVDDLQKYLDRAEELGGKTLMPVTDMGEVTFAMFADPQGTTFGLYKTNG